MKTTLYIDFIHDLGKGRYLLEGYLGGQPVNLENISIHVGTSTSRLRSVVRPLPQDIEAQHPIKDSTFQAQINFSVLKKNKMVAKAGEVKIPIKTNRFTGMGNLLLSHKVHGELVWTLRNGAVVAYPALKRRIFLLELCSVLAIILNWRIPFAVSRLRGSLSKGGALQLTKSLVIVAESIITIPKALLLRAVYHAHKTFMKRRIVWLISDRGMSGGDNGEALFLYVSKLKNLSANVYFVISKSSRDYKRLKKIGRVVNQGSMKHLLLFLLSDKIISSQADIEATNPFLRQVDRYVGFFDFDFVFLQHGIIRHDLSEWLSRFNKNIKLFITSSQVEYDSILSNLYCYEKENILLSGLPRFDFLESKPKGKLILAPTYRKFLINGRTNSKGARKYNKKFKQSNFFSFYNKLMNDAELISVMQMVNMTGELYLHPVLAAQAPDFVQNKNFKVMKYPYSYKKAFEEGNLLVSDHSSVIFDFAYLRKPVLYAHFDSEDFFAGHTYTKSEFYDDRKDGFGPVCANYQELKEEIIKTIQSGCLMDARYMERADKFFAFKDQNNTERVYNAILKLDV